MPRILLALVFAMALPLSGAAQVIRGRLIEDVTNRGIANSRVEMLDQRGEIVVHAVSDSLGWFVLEAELAGSYRLHAQSFGHREATSPPITVAVGDRLDVRFVLSPDVQLLAPLEVVARSRPLIADMALTDFHERRAKGLGFALTHDDWKNQNPRAVSDLLRQLPGVIVQQGGVGSARIRVAGPGRLATECNVKVFMDGIEFRAGHYAIDDIAVHDVYAIEVFRGLASLPIEFAAADAKCGVIAIWTKRGTR